MWFAERSGFGLNALLGPPPLTARPHLDGHRNRYQGTGEVAATLKRGAGRLILLKDSGRDVPSKRCSRSYRRKRELRSRFPVDVALCGISVLHALTVSDPDIGVQLSALDLCGVAGRHSDTDQHCSAFHICSSRNNFCLILARG